jgi:predicted TIM-barrel fold metal-dependent hydrolase
MMLASRPTNLAAGVFLVLACILSAALAAQDAAQTGKSVETDKASGAAPSGEPVLDGRDGRPLALDQFRPQPMLRVEEHRLARAKFPVVDVHVHPRVRLTRSPAKELDDFVRTMDEQNIAACVSLDGGLGDAFEEHKTFLWTRYRDRFVIFANIDWRGSGAADKPATWDCNRPDFVHRVVKQLEAAKTGGASGLKLFKNFGLEYRNADGSLIKIDDPRWDPIWETCGRLGLVVLMHTADPGAFFQPIDQRNERWEELRRNPSWSFHGKDFPTRDELHAARNRVIGRHPKTTFIAAHVANDGEDLKTVAEWLDKYPNMYVELAARIAELGRQPFTARKFLIRYADRVMFGTDGPRAASRLALHWRFLETEDEYFPYAENPFPPQGFWSIYGVGLPDEVLRKIYHENAVRIVPGVKDRIDAYVARKR